MYLSHSRVQATHANRGNVAIIVWNTLEAPYVWDVQGTEYEGTINLGNVSRSLLSIHFRDYMNITKTESGKETYAFKEIEHVSVSKVPSMSGTLGEKQIVLDLTDVDLSSEEEAFVNGIDTKVPRRENSKEWTTRDEDNTIITAYAPELEDLDAYYGKVVTVIFGEDNKVVSIRVVDDTVENQFLTAYEDKKLTIGGEKYKFAKEYEISINTVTNDYDMADVKRILSIDDITDITKVIKANVRLDNDGNVTRLDLFASGNFDDVKTRETIVSKVRNEIITLKNGVELDYSEDGEYEEEDDRPRIMRDNKIIDMEDIAVGDVLTYYVDKVETDLDDEKITTIYVSSEKVDGELTRASKKDLKLTVNGEKYLSSEASVLFTADKISDAASFNEGDIDKYIGENITLYLNVYGEYVLMASEKAENDWTFGILTSVRDTEDDEEDDDIYRIPVRILMADGSTARNYKFLFDDEEDDGSVAAWENKVASLVNKFIVFSADANNEIDAEDFAEVEARTLKTFTEDDFDAESVSGGGDADDDRQTIEVGSGTKVFSSSSVIFNLGQNLNEKLEVVDNGSAGDGEVLKSDVIADISDVEAGDFVMNVGSESNPRYEEYVASYEPETSKDWDLLVSGDELAQDALVIYETDKRTISYVVINVPEEAYVVSDAEYAIVYTEDYKEVKGSKTKRYVDLLLAGSSDAETIEAKSLNTTYADGLAEMFVQFKLSASKLTSVEKMIDLPAFKKLKANKEVTTEIANTTETKLVAKIEDAVDAEHGNVAACAGTCTNAAHDHTSATATAWDTCGEASCTNGCTNASHDHTSATVTAWDRCSTTVACPNDNDTEAIECGCENFRQYVSNRPIKANFKVVDTQNLMLEYEDNDEVVNYSFDVVSVDKDVIVYDARGGKIVETTFKALREEVAKDGDLYVIPFANSDANGYYSATNVEETDVTKIDANILVIVD